MPIYSAEAAQLFEQWKAAYLKEHDAIKALAAAGKTPDFMQKLTELHAMHDESMRLFNELQAYRIDK